MRSFGRVLAAGAIAALVGAAAVLVACGSRTGITLVPVDAAVADDFRNIEPIDCVKEGITYIYVVSVENEIYSFYPQTGEFTDIGVLSCPASPGTSPFSMAVDRKGIAYVVFDDGNLYRVSTKTGQCEQTLYIPDQLGFGTFGMGFVANQGDGGETLYVAKDGDAGALGTIDTTTFQVHDVGPFSDPAVSRAELTGTGGGHLYGFYAPDNSVSPSYIVEIDPNNAAVLGSTTLPGVVEGGGWAFGFWGGDFYTFTAPDGPPSVVTRYRPSDHTIVQVATAPPGVEVVGAGVSTCAPQQ